MNFAAQTHKNMGEHLEPEENEIAGPVIVAVSVLAIIVMCIYFMGS